MTLSKRVYATFKSHEELFIWLAEEAKKRGYGTKRTIFLADGSEHIWRLQKLYFAEAETCLDWFHLIEHLWSAGRAVHAEGSDELRAWIARQSRRLRRGATRAVRKELWRMLQAIPRKGPGNKARRKRLHDMLHYYDVNNGRMRYNELRKDDLDIGTGAVEGSVPSSPRSSDRGPAAGRAEGQKTTTSSQAEVRSDGRFVEFLEHYGIIPAAQN